MPWPMRLGPEPRMMHRRPVARRDLGLLVVGASSGTASWRRTRPRRCRRSCRPAAARARAGRLAHPVLGRCPRSAADLRVAEAVPLGPRAAPRRVSSRRGLGLGGILVRAGRAGRGTTGRSLVAVEDLLGRAPPARMACHDDAAAGRRAASAIASEQLVRWRPVDRPRRSRRPCFSSERSAFCSASVKLAADGHRLADATSCAWSASASAAGNFSNANRGTFTTT